MGSPIRPTWVTPEPANHRLDAREHSRVTVSETPGRTRPGILSTSTRTPLLLGRDAGPAYYWVMERRLLHAACESLGRVLKTAPPMRGAVSPPPMGGGSLSGSGSSPPRGGSVLVCAICCEVAAGVDARLGRERMKIRRGGRRSPWSPPVSKKLCVVCPEVAIGVQSGGKGLKRVRLGLARAFAGPI